jgi:hypothetical protein
MATLAVSPFAAPIMLLGIVAVALPILAHLMNRRTRQRLVFPTIRLLTQSRATQSSLYRIRRWVLLALRCLAVVMVALAFAMPSCAPKAAPDRDDAKAQSGASVVLLLDVSASLARDVDGVNLVNTMRAVAQRTLSTLLPGEDRANIIYAGARPRTAMPHQKGQMSLSANLDAVRDDLNSLAATQERADLPAAIALAGDMLKNAPGQKRLVIVSDMQQSNWRDVSLGGDAATLLPPGTVITVLPLETGKPANIALSDVRAEPLKAIVNQPALLIAKATNHTGAAKEITVTATLDGQPIGAKAVQLNAGESRDVAFDAAITTPGRHRVEFSLGDDAFTADNRAYLAVTAVQRVPIFIVGDDNPGELGTASYFLSRALSPRGDAGDLLEVRHMTSADLAAADLAGAEAVFLSQVNLLMPEAARALVEYLRRGGGVVFFMGDRARLNTGGLAQAGLELTLAREGSGGRLDNVTSWLPTTHRDLAATGAVLRITEGEWGSELLSEFDEQSRAALAQIRFHKVWEVSDLNPAAKVLLTFSDKTPALSILPVGEGRLVTVNFSPALTATDFGKYGSFVAFTHSLARYVRPKRDWRSQATVGQPILASAAVPVGEGPGRFLVEGPAGKTFTPDLSRIGTRMAIAVDRAPAAGFYRVLRNDQPVGDVALNLDPRESDLRALAAAEITEQLKTAGTTVEVKGQSAEGDILDVRGQPLWHWFVLLAMVMIGLELALLAVWNR